MADLAVVVVQVPRPTGKVPLIEQTYSAGAVCLSLLNAALAQGWGANWLSGWPTYDETFRREGLGLRDGESVAGIIHIGTPVAESPDRPRPDVAKLTTWADFNGRNQTDAPSPARLTCRGSGRPRRAPGAASPP